MPKDKEQYKDYTVVFKKHWQRGDALEMNESVDHIWRIMDLKVELIVSSWTGLLCV